ncbi:TPA: hypothetical protein DCY65_03550 [Candidatus Acetothermia bacterium]|nr:hypothetical protein [Candidatus Acetothermia bacterium]HAZ30630.1 hypothetical protein [Candidatus Acetothermia bacterium]
MFGRRRVSLNPRPVRAKDEGAAWAYLERLVAHRPRTVAELHRRLSDKGFSQEITQAAVARAGDAGIVDDRLFARLYAEDRLLSRPCSRRLLAAELRNRGVEASLAEHAARAALPELSEEDLARHALAGRLPLWGRLDPEVACKRAAAFLLRRGFSSALAREVVTETFGGEWTSE